LGRELEKAQLEYYPDPQKALKEQYDRGDINKKSAKIDAKQRELDQLRQGLNDLEDQLRKSVVIRVGAVAETKLSSFSC